MYQQANALAAETARQWDRASRREMGASSRPHVNLDWYSVDTKEQWSAFHGDVLVSTVVFRDIVAFCKCNLVLTKFCS